GPCARVLLGVEEHEPGQTRLVDPVGELRHQTSSEQTAEPGAPKDHTQITEEGGGHDLRVGGPCRGSVFEGNRRVTGEHTGRRYTHEEGVYRRHEELGNRSGSVLAGDEALDPVMSLCVAVLDGRRLHEVGGGGQERTPDTAVLGDLGRTNGVDDDARGVGESHTSSLYSR